MNGAASTLTTDTAVALSATAGENKLVAKTLYAQITVGADAKIGTPVVATTTIDKIGNVGNLLFLQDDTNTTYGYVAGKTIADSVPVITIDKASGTASVGTAVDLVTPVTGADNIYVVYNPQNTAAVAAVYILV